MSGQVRVQRNMQTVAELRMESATAPLVLASSTGDMWAGSIKQGMLSSPSGSSAHAEGHGVSAHAHSLDNQRAPGSNDQLP